MRRDIGNLIKSYLHRSHRKHSDFHPVATSFRLEESEGLQIVYARMIRLASLPVRKHGTQPVHSDFNAQEHRAPIFNGPSYEVPGSTVTSPTQVHVVAVAS
jgi:hypothetical protein